MGDDSVIPRRSVEGKGNDIVAAPEVHLGVSTRAYHDVLLAADHIAGGWRVDARAGMEVPQFLAAGGVIGGKLAVAFARKDQTACGGQNAADHRLPRLDLAPDLAGVLVDGGDIA